MALPTKEQTRRDIARLTAQGFTIRLYTTAEINKRLEDMKKRQN